MIPLWAALALAGAAKSELIDRPKEERQRHLAAETQRYSPWTGMQAGGIQEADPFGSALQGGMTGVSLDQASESADNAKKLQDQQLETMKTQNELYKKLARNPQFGGSAPSPMMSSQNPTLSYWTQLMNKPQY